MLPDGTDDRAISRAASADGIEDGSTVLVLLRRRSPSGIVIGLHGHSSAAYLAGGSRSRLFASTFTYVTPRYSIVPWVAPAVARTNARNRERH